MEAHYGVNGEGITIRVGEDMRAMCRTNTEHVTPYVCSRCSVQMRCVNT